MMFVLKSDVSVNRTDDGMVLLDQRSGRYWQLNPTGAWIVQLLIDGRTAAEVADELRAAHPEDGDRIATDVSTLLENLRSAGVVRS